MIDIRSFIFLLNIPVPGLPSGKPWFSTPNSGTIPLLHWPKPQYINMTPITRPFANIIFLWQSGQGLKPFQVYSFWFMVL
jgi:hypothetical protein